MSTAMPRDRRLALLSHDRQHATRLADATAIELLHWILSDGQVSDGQAKRADGLVQLAQLDPSLAAWLVDWTTGGAAGCLIEGPSDPDRWAPVQAREISDSIKRLRPSDLLRKLSESIACDDLHEPTGQDWATLQRRSSMMADRALERAKSLHLARIGDVYWWSTLLTAPWYERDSQGSGWTRISPIRQALSVASEHPLFDCLKCLEYADVQVAVSLAAKLDRSPSGMCLWQSELNLLSHVFPSLLRLMRRCDELEREFQTTLEHEKLLAMKELAYGASHEINNPLANISSRAQLLMRDESDAEKRRSLATINSQAFRAHEMIADMMLFAKPPKLQLEEICITELVRNVIGELADELPKDVHLKQNVPPETWIVRGDSVQLTVALRAIWSNALEAMAGEGRLTVTVRTIRSEPSEPHLAWAEVEIADTGSGIRPEVRQHLFDPFFSGREAGRGLGFGLSKAWRIIQLHGGHITVASEPGEGAALTLYLPRVVTSPRIFTSPRGGRTQ